MFRFIPIFLLFLIGCETLDKMDKEYSTSNEVEKIEIKADDIPDLEYAWGRMPAEGEWTHYTKEALLKYPEMLKINPKDSHRYCERFTDLSTIERVQFYTALISAMAKFESSHRPETTYAEAFKNGKGETVISTGLLQLSYESARGYNCVDATTEKLKNARFNIDCGVKILNRWITRDKQIGTRINGKWLGGARYWSVLRPKSDTATVHKIRRITKDLKICMK